MKKLLLLTTTLMITVALSAQVIHIPGDYATIQAGIDAATDGDTVLVDTGTYFENINYNGKAITVASHFLLDGDTNHINNTIIDGSQPVNPDFASVVSFINDEDSSSVICGFTITGGTGTTDPVYGARIGGGIVCHDAAAKIIHNKITGNQVNASLYAWGGGVACIRETGSDWIVIAHNTISNNQSSAINGVAHGGGGTLIGNARVTNNMISANDVSAVFGEVLGCGIFYGSYNTVESLILETNKIRYNTGQVNDFAYGGGLYCAGSNLFITKNDIGHNTLNGGHSYGAGIFLDQGLETHILGNTISNNTLTTTNNYWFGAGICCLEPLGDIMISNNNFMSNSGPVAPVGAGGAISLLEGYNTLISIHSNYFNQNEAYNGGAIFTRSTYQVNLLNNIFRNNHANRGGAIGIYNPAKNSDMSAPGTKDFQPGIINNTFFSNEAINGGAIRFEGLLSVPEIVNCIFWENTSPTGKDISNQSGISMPVSYSDVETANIIGPWWGDGNFYADPKFIALDPHCHLSSASPCRDSGIVNDNTPAVDFDGDARPDPVTGLMDIGADEYYDIPAAPVAVAPPEQGSDYFMAAWYASEKANGYYLDVASDTNFTNILNTYNNYNTGADTSQLVEGVEQGMYYYRVKAYNDWGVSIYSNTITVDLFMPGMDEQVPQKSNHNMQCYPNPTRGIVGCQLSIAESQQVSLNVFDIHGREVADVPDAKLQAGEHMFRIDLSAWPEGVYLLRLQAGDVVETAKVILMK